ncbi:MAG: DUF268 domain-containing protein [Simkaniaceae bacterium]|nr:MAG: DUF268 domain-containing protein [Simkaniaceae bacterium]
MTCGFSSPPKYIPQNLYHDFTMGSQIPVKYEYYDNAYLSNKPLVYTTKMVDDFIDGISTRSIKNYGYGTDEFLYDAIEKNIAHIEGKKVAIMGSTSPFYECVVLYYGGTPVTIDYNKIESLDKRIHTMTVQELQQNPIQFDAVISISSFEHDGLGRYGDPINPKGDLEAMASTLKLLKEGGVLFLAVPIGPDSLLWNGCRIYGELRLPLLLKGWEILDSFGFSVHDFNREKFAWHHQPVFLVTPCADLSKKHYYINDEGVI